MALEERLKIKFVIMKLRDISNNNQYGKRMVNNIDHVIYDIFNVKDFTKKIVNSIDDRDVSLMFNRVGLKNMMDICDNPAYFNIFTKMVEIDYAILYTKRMLRKRKSKNKKRLSEELKGMEKIYRRAIKKMKRKFGIKSSNSAYKNRFRTLIDFSEDDDLFDDDLASIYYDDDDFYGDSWDDDWDNDSEFQRFADLYYSRHKIKRTPERKRRRSSLLDDDLLDDDLEDWEDDDDDLTSEDKGSDKIGNLEMMMAQMANQISNLTSQVSKMAVVEKSLPPVNQTPVRDLNLTDRSSNNETDKMLKILLDKQERQNALIANTIEEQNRQREATNMILEFLTNVDEDDDDIPDSDSYLEEINKYQDVATEATYAKEEPEPQPQLQPKQSSDGLSRDELIDLINHPK